jgi:hypothetical protein
MDERIGLTLRELLSCPVVFLLPEAVNPASSDFHIAIIVDH